MRSSKKENASRAVLYVLIIVAIVIGAQFLVSGASGISPIYVVVSSSMVPTLEVGDLVMTQVVPFSDIHVGDVIIYVPPTSSGGCSGEDIVHRVVATTPQGLITQGDNRRSNPAPDEPLRWPPVTPACVKGKVIAAVPYIGLISMAIPPPYNYLLVGMVLLLVFLLESRPGRKGSEGSPLLPPPPEEGQRSPFHLRGNLASGNLISNDRHRPGRWSARRS